MAKSPVESTDTTASSFKVYPTPATPNNGSWKTSATNPNNVGVGSAKKGLGEAK